MSNVSPVKLVDTDKKNNPDENTPESHEENTKSMNVSALMEKLIGKQGKESMDEPQETSSENNEVPKPANENNDLRKLHVALIVIILAGIAITFLNKGFLESNSVTAGETETASEAPPTDLPGASKKTIDPAILLNVLSQE